MHVQVYVQVGPVSCMRPGDGRCLRNKWVLFFSPLHGGVNARPALKGKFPQPAPSCFGSGRARRYREVHAVGRRAPHPEEFQRHQDLRE